MDESQRISHYELRRLLGRGGMGEVYEAHDLKTRRAVALKFVAPELAADPQIFRRFEAEAHAAAAMNHPHIATIYAFEPEGDRPFIAMELVSGESLRARIARGPLAIDDALGIARDVASALAYAHRRGIVHRDIKPENLMFDEEGRIKVMDFGLAQATHGTRLTMVGASVGTPSYMSPEALQGTSGPPTDVFAVGLVLSEMLTGMKVFSAESPMAEMFMIANMNPPPLRERRAEVPEVVEALVSRTIDKNQTRRPDAATLARELGEMTGVRVPQYEPLPPGDAAARAAAAAPASSSADTRALTGGGGLSGAQTVPIVRAPGPSEAGTVPALALTDAPPRSVAKPSRRPLWIVLAAVLVLAAGAFAWMQRSAAAARERRAESVLLNNQALAAIQRGAIDDARRLVTQALAKDPGYGEAQFNLANVYDLAGQQDSAAALYGRIVKEHARDTRLLAMALYNLGDIDLRTNAPDQAAEHLSQSFARDSSRLEVYNNLGYALIEARRPGDAIPVLTRGIARFPGAAPLYKNAAVALMALDRENEALGFLDRALARDPNLLSARGWRARVRARLGDRAGAAADWKIYGAADVPPRERAEVEQDLAEHEVDLVIPGLGGPRHPAHPVPPPLPATPP